ncbi:lipopolysaccharide biosynthesis protein [Kordiimonas marina]|uniref:lipopolysaccharide biosynthesis protein n=1 Tax=Kordiimonas marina TaxID=2872312 RepID=UPI001FF134F2|nr:oligosaccharide flippase family protein [Kordiimonas marina]MCJ9429974.1 oligosaccharide flippase family protein [Kordiimonas marina]
MRRLLGKHQLRALFSAYSANAAGRVTGILLQLALVPLLLKTLGVENYGALVLYNTLITSGMLLDMGMSQSVAKFVAEHRRKARLLREVKNSAWFVYLALSTLFAAICLLIAPVMALLGIPTPKVGSLDLTTFTTICAIGVFPYMQHFLFVEVARGLMRYRAVAAAEITQQVLSQSFAITLALITRNLVFVFLGQIAATAIVAAGMWTYLKVQQQVTVGGGFNLNYFRRRILPYSRGVWLQAIFSFASSSADRFIIVGTLGFASLGYYNIAFSAAGAVMSVVIQGAAFVTPMVANRAKDFEWCRMVFERVILGMSIVSGLVALTLTFTGHILLSLWIDAETATKVYHAFVIILWFFAFQSTSTAQTSVANVIGKIRVVTVFSVSYAILSTICTAVLGLMFAMPGILLARAVMIVLGLISRSLIYKYSFHNASILGVAKYSLPLLIPAAIIVPWAWLHL